MRSSNTPAPETLAGITRRRVAVGAAWTVPAVLVAGAAPARAASPDRCEDTGLQPFPAPILLYDKDDNQPARVNRLPYTANGWTARKVGQVDKGGFSFSAFEGGGFRNTLDPVARNGDQVDTFVEATATTIPGCTYTLVSSYEFTGTGNDRPMAAWLQVDGVDSGIRANSNDGVTRGTITTTFAATSTSTLIGLHTRVTGTDLANGGVDINMSQPIITCDCSASSG